jgi:hypothetical protein
VGLVALGLFVHPLRTAFVPCPSLHANGGRAGRGFVPPPLCRGPYPPKTAFATLANLQSEELALYEALPRRKHFPSTETWASDTLTNPMPSGINRLAVPALAPKGLHVVVKPCNLRRSLLFKEIAIMAVPRSPCLQNILLMTVQASSMAPAVPGRRVDATVPGPRRVAGHYIGTYGGPPMSPLRCPDKTKAPRSLIAVSIRLVQRYARARRRTRATVQKPFQRRGEVFSHNPPPLPRAPPLSSQSKNDLNHKTSISRGAQLTIAAGWRM